MESTEVETESPGLPALAVPMGLAVLVAPRAVFARTEDTPAYGWALLLLIGLLMLIGYAKVQTGLIDRDVDAATEKKLEVFETSQGILIDRVEFRERVESIQKEGQFAKVINRLGAVVLGPLGMLASIMLIASFFYAIVALTGRKPEYHTLMSICVYAAFIELLAAVVQLAMMLYFRTTSVTTTLQGFSAGPKPTILWAIDPFRIWFWALVTIGLIATHQLGRKVAIGCCLVLCLGAIGIRFAMQSAGA